MAITPGSRSGNTTDSRSAVGRGKNIGLWTLQSLLAGVYMLSALPKLVADHQTIADFARLGFSPVAMYVIAGLEIAGAVALLTPRLCGFAALAFVGLMIGATVATVLGIGAGQAILPGIVLVVVAVVAWGRRHRTAEIVAGIATRAGSQRRSQRRIGDDRE